MTSRSDAAPALVVHASRHGSTREVAEAIAAVLADHGLPAVVSAAREVRGSVAGWRLVVVGGALYSGRWHRDARRFLKRHRDELARVPVAVFGMGPRETGDEAWARARGQLDRALARLPWLEPAAVALFGGVDPPRREDRPRRDVRDWTVIRGWAADVAALATVG